MHCFACGQLAKNYTKTGVATSPPADLWPAQTLHDLALNLAYTESISVRNRVVMGQ